MSIEGQKARVVRERLTWVANIQISQLESSFFSPVYCDGHESEDRGRHGHVRHEVVHRAIGGAKRPVSEKDMSTWYETSGRCEVIFSRTGTKSFDNHFTFKCSWPKKVNPEERKEEVRTYIPSRGAISAHGVNCPNWQLYEYNKSDLLVPHEDKVEERVEDGHEEIDDAQVDEEVVGRVPQVAVACNKATG